MSFSEEEFHSSDEIIPAHNKLLKVKRIEGLQYNFKFLDAWT